MPRALHLSLAPVLVLLLLAVPGCSAYPGERPTPVQNGELGRLTFVGVPEDPVAVGGSVEVRLQRPDGNTPSGVRLSIADPEIVELEDPVVESAVTRIFARRTGTTDVVVRGVYLDTLIDQVQVRTAKVARIGVCTLGPDSWDPESSCGSAHLLAGATVPFLVRATMGSGGELWGVPSLAAEVSDPAVLSVGARQPVDTRNRLTARAAGEAVVTFSDEASGTTGTLEVSVHEAADLQAEISGGHVIVWARSATGEVLEGADCAFSPGAEGVSFLPVETCETPVIWNGEGARPDEVPVDVIERVSGLTATFMVPLTE